MDYNMLSPKEKIRILNDAVINNSPAEVSALLKELGKVEHTCMALTNAYRFSGFEMVKVLVEGGASFAFNGYASYEIRDGFFREWGYNPLFYLVLLDVGEINGCYRTKFLQNVNDLSVRKYGARYSIKYTGNGEHECSAEEREKSFDYLCDNSEKAGIDLGELLFYAYFAQCETKIKKLKERGVTFSETRISMLNGTSGRTHSDDWSEYCWMIRGISRESFIPVMQNIVDETGDCLHFTEIMTYGSAFEWFTDPEMLGFILNSFNQSKMNKTRIMKIIIKQDKPECLEVVSKNGWLKMPKKRDEMIDFASESHATECTAWLLDFKNRTADLAAERLKAEKKAERELNADPNSVMELKKVWSFEKTEDDTILIKGYKGNRTEINVPEKIGKKSVTAIGDHAFSPGGSRLTVEQRNFRRTIVKVTLPDSISVISGGAFEGCESLTRVNIPDGVTEIGTSAFLGCKKLSGIVIPDSVQKIGVAALAASAIVSVKIPRGVTEIHGMFYSCERLENIELPDTLQKIGKECFLRCKALKKIIIPEGVTEIGQMAFNSCENLETVVIPASVKSIKNYKNSYKYTNNKTLYTIFHGCGKVTVIVPKSSYAEKYCKRNNIPYSYREPIL